jgi:hypothetical protein
MIERARLIRFNVQNDDDLSVIGGASHPSPIPEQSEAEAIWRRAYVDYMVKHGVDREDAQACCDAGEVDLSETPEDAAEGEMQCWDGE